MALVLVDGGFEGAWVIAAVVFIVAAVTDFIDGYLARRWEVTSTLGAFLDSLADKLLVAGALFALVEVGRAWAWAAFIIVGREVAVMGLRGLAAALDGTKVPPSVWGKLKANLQYLAVGLAMLRPDTGWGPLFPDEWVMIAAVAATLLSGFEYFSRFRRVLSPG